MMRQMASIKRIDEIRPAENADALELAIIGGWQVVVKKDEFKANDLVVYFEIDSELDQYLEWVKEHASFLEARKWRVRTIKLRGNLSQGLVLPVSILPDMKDKGCYIVTRDVDTVEIDSGCSVSLSQGDIVYIKTNYILTDVTTGLICDVASFGEDGREPFGIPQDAVTPFDIVEDVNVSGILKVKKYEPPICNVGGGFGGKMLGAAKGNYPSHLIPKTDETRVQSAMRVLDELKGNPYYMTVKYDGTSATFLYVDGEFNACSRNIMKKDDEDNIYWKMARKYNLAEKLADRQNLAIQGEICGPSIQSNKLGLKEHGLFVFNVYDIEKGRYLGYDDFIEVCDDLELDIVPVEEVGDSFNYTLEQLLEKAKGKYPGCDHEREGLVIRPRTEMYSEKLRGRLSFKCINNEFLLKEKD